MDRYKGKVIISGYNDYCKGYKNIVVIEIGRNKLKGDKIVDIRVIKKNDVNIAVIASDDIIINNAQDALDLIMTLRYEYSCEKVIINKKNITEDFFELKTGIAGEIMQKHINYQMALAIIGEFEQYNSKSLNSLIYESNKGNKIIFKSTEAEAIDALYVI